MVVAVSDILDFARQVRKVQWRSPPIFFSTPAVIRCVSDLDHSVFARLYDPVMYIAERTMLGAHREYLAADLSGRVLELGAGTGAMFPYLADDVATDTISLYAIEPDQYMRIRASKRARELDLDVQLSDARAETLPYEDDAFDAVLTSFVFCTIPDHERALSEVARVLKPGGEFRFVEHVRGDGVVGSVHDALAPGWHAVAGGCHLNRDTGEMFLRDDRFRPMDYTRQESGVSALLPTVRGTLERKSESSLRRIIGRK
jgi:SAM-dependent methyltransferase